jgi:hypothetical protein
MVRDVAQLAGVEDWTDVAPGNGRVTAAVTEGLPLRSRHLLIPPHLERPPSLSEWTYERGDLMKWAGSQSGDCVSLFDVIEHLARPEADDVLTRLERTYRIVVVFTPLGFMRQDGVTDPGIAHDPTMWHRSGFWPGDFERRGYVVCAWPLYHPGAGVGAILALRVPPHLREPAERACLARYRELRRSESFVRAVARWLRARARR